MNKQELIKKIANASNIKKTDAATSLDTVIASITNTLANGDTVSIPGFGSFTTTVREARTGRNPKTGEQIQIPKKVVAKFRPGKVLKETLNK